MQHTVLNSYSYNFHKLVVYFQHNSSFLFQTRAIETNANPIFNPDSPMFATSCLIFGGMLIAAILLGTAYHVIRQQVIKRNGKFVSDYVGRFYDYEKYFTSIPYHLSQHVPFSKRVNFPSRSIFVIIIPICLRAWFCQ